MISNLFIAGDSLIHRLAPKYKILGLLVASTGIFLIPSVWIIAAICCLVVSLYLYASIPLKIMAQQLKPVFWLLAIIFIVQYFTQDIEIASLVVMRFFCLILLASLVTLTTQTAQMVEGIENLLKYFHRWLPVERISLTVTLCIRFIPTIREIVEEVKEAQYARGMSRNILAIAVPVIIRSLRMADQISEAIYARGFETEPYHPDQK